MNMLIKDKLRDLLMKITFSFKPRFSDKILATSTVLIPLGSNQNHIPIALQQKLETQIIRSLALSAIME